MFRFLSGDDVPAQIELLNAQVCSMAPDVAGCEVGVETWWPTIASIIFSQDAARIACAQLSGGMCDEFQTKYDFSLFFKKELITYSIHG